MQAVTALSVLWQSEQMVWSKAVKLLLNTAGAYVTRVLAGLELLAKL